MSKFIKPFFIAPNIIVEPVTLPPGLVAVYCKHGDTFTAKCFDLDAHEDVVNRIVDFIGYQNQRAVVKLASDNPTVKSELEARNIFVETGCLYLTKREVAIFKDLTIVPLYGPEGLLARLAEHGHLIDIYVYTPPPVSIVASIKSTQNELVICDQSMRQLIGEQDTQESLDMRRLIAKQNTLESFYMRQLIAEQNTQESLVMRQLIAKQDTQESRYMRMKKAKQAKQAKQNKLQIHYLPFSYHLFTHEGSVMRQGLFPLSLK
jgi:hypothetical protein